MRNWTTSFLAAACLGGCATPFPPASQIYGQIAMVVGADSQGRLRLIVGGADDAGRDRIRINGTVMQLTPCAWSAAKPTVTPAPDVTVIEVMDGGFMKGPQSLSRDLLAALDRRIAARGLRPSPPEIACARSLLDDMAFSEDSN